MDRNQQQDLLKALAAALEKCNEAGPQHEEHAIGHFTLGPVDAAAPEPPAVGYLTASGVVEALKLLGADTELALRSLEDSVLIDVDSLNRRKAELMAKTAHQDREAIDSGEFTTDAFITSHLELATEIMIAFNEMDPRDITAAVLDQPGVDKVRTLEALDDWFGATADPYDDDMDADGLGQDGDL